MAQYFRMPAVLFSVIVSKRRITVLIFGHGQQIHLHLLCQVHHIFQETSQTFAHLHWREVAQMCTVQQIIQIGCSSEEPLVMSH